MQEKEARNEEIYRLHRSVLSFNKLAGLYKLTPQRVHAIVKLLKIKKGIK